MSFHQRKATQNLAPKTMKQAMEETGKDPSLERTFRGHRGKVHSCSFSPTMTQLVSGGEDNCLMLWKFQPTLRAFRFVGHKGPVNHVEFSPTGNLIASASKDRTVRLWLPNPKGESTVLKGHTGAVRCASFSPDGHKLLTTSDDKTAKLWGLAGRKFLATLQGHTHWVRTAKWSPDGRLVATGSDDKTVRLWEVQRRQCLHTFFDCAGEVAAVDFSPDGTCLAAGSADRSLKVWDTRSYTLLQHYPAHRAPVAAARFHPSGLYLLTASGDSTLKIWDVREGRLLYTIHGHQGAVGAAAWSKDGAYFSSGGDDNLVMVWKSNLGGGGGGMATGGMDIGDHSSPQRATNRQRRSIPSTAPPSHYAEPNSSLITSPPRVSREVEGGFADIWSERQPDEVSSSEGEAAPWEARRPPPPPQGVAASLQSHASLDPDAVQQLLNSTGGLSLGERSGGGGGRGAAAAAGGGDGGPARTWGAGPRAAAAPMAAAAGGGRPGNGGEGGAARGPPGGWEGVRGQLPEVLAGTLEHIVGQMDLITRTLAVMEQRLTYTEDKIHQLSEQGVFITADDTDCKRSSAEVPDEEDANTPPQIQAVLQQWTDEEAAEWEKNLAKRMDEIACAGCGSNKVTQAVQGKPYIPFMEWAQTMSEQIGWQAIKFSGCIVPGGYQCSECGGVDMLRA